MLQSESERGNKNLNQEEERYEPVERVPLPNSSRRTRERAVELRRARDTWFKSIMNADWTFDTDSRVDMRVKTRASSSIGRQANSLSEK
jgi:hypothetical protein